MNSPQNHIQLVATTSFGLEAIVARELSALGFSDLKTLDGRVYFEGDRAAICRANLWLRCADRVAIVFGRFKAYDFGQLFDQTTELPWEQWIPRDGRFPVVGRSVKSQLHSVPDCQSIVKKAAVERLKRVYGCSWFNESGPIYEIEVSVLKDEVTLTIDTSGYGLHRRGYRRLNARAPLRETLAAALVDLSVWHPDRAFVDPCCGSGTIAIEAALQARNIAPGLRRDFASCHWQQFGDGLWQQARSEAMSAVKPDLKDKLVGTDIDGAVIDMARFHAKQAGVEGSVHFQQRRMEEFSSKRQYGCWITNPPYGERLGDREEVEELYRRMGGLWAQHETWSFFTLTAHPDFEGFIGARATRRRKLYNGNLPCTYFQFLGPRPPRSEAATPVDEPESPGDPQ